MVKNFFERLLKRKETCFMAVVAKPRSSLNKKKCDFNKLDWNKTSCLVVVSCINLPLTAKYPSEKLIAK